MDVACKLETWTTIAWTQAGELEERCVTISIDIIQDNEVQLIMKAHEIFIHVYRLLPFKIP